MSYKSNYKEKMKESKSSGSFMNSPVGMCSYKKNPLPAPRRGESKLGPGSNADQNKANDLMKKAHKEKEQLRGEGF